MTADEVIVIDSDPVDEAKEVTVEKSVVAPGFPWWILGLMAAGFVLIVVVGKGQMS